jgi:nitrogenase-associated protein
MEIKFYEKPGCTNNTRQKIMLLESGHVVTACSILKNAWTAETLKPFFNGLPVAEWFNMAAPRIKSGEVIPADFDENAAIQAMLADPLLIRRPLMEVDDTFICGFDNEFVQSLIQYQDASHVQSCPNLSDPCM